MLIGEILSNSANQFPDKPAVICGKDMTTEATVTKLMFLLGKDLTNEVVKNKLQTLLNRKIVWFPKRNSNTAFTLGLETKEYKNWVHHDFANYLEKTTNNNLLDKFNRSRS